MFGLLEHVESFKMMLTELSKQLQNVQEVQNKILGDINTIKRTQKKSDKKFDSFAEGFYQIRKVSLSLANRLDQVLGPISGAQKEKDHDD